MKNKNKISLNSSIQEKVIINKKHLDYFRSITGDKNPIHTSKKFAKKNGFSQPVVYGLLTSSFLSAVIGNKLPGPGALWTNCNFTFKSPVFLNDELTIEAKVIHISYSTSMIKIDFSIKNQFHKIVLEGDSDIKIDLKQISKKPKKNLNIKKSFKREKTNYPTIIIGGSSEIGTHLIKSFPRNKILIATYRNKKNFLDKISNQKKLIKEKLDVLNNQSIKKFCKKIKLKFGGISELIYLPAGNLLLKNIKETNYKDFLKDFEINALGFLKIFQTMEKELLLGKAKIVLMSTESVGSIPAKNQSSYVASKSALSSIGKSIASEYSNRGIKINIIAPGLINTKFTKNIPEVSKEIYRSQNLSGELTNIDEVTSLIKFILNNKYTNNNGMTYYINKRES